MIVGIQSDPPIIISEDRRKVMVLRSKRSITLIDGWANFVAECSALLDMPDAMSFTCIADLERYFDANPNSHYIQHRATIWSFFVQGAAYMVSLEKE